MYEGRPQRFGNQWRDDLNDGRPRPWKLADPDHVDELRASVGLGPMPPIPEPGAPLHGDHRPRLEETRAWWGKLYGEQRMERRVNAARLTSRSEQRIRQPA